MKVRQPQGLVKKEAKLMLYNMLRREKKETTANKAQSVETGSFLAHARDESLCVMKGNSFYVLQCLVSSRWNRRERRLTVSGVLPDQ